MEILVLLAIIVGFSSVQGDNEVYVTTGDQIKKFNKDKVKTTIIYKQPQRKIIGLGADLDGKFLFWSDVSSGHSGIYRSDLDGRNVTTIVRDVGKVQSISADWVSNHIYWTDSQRKTVEIANYDGSGRRILVSTDLQQPQAVIVDPVFGFIFWYDQKLNKIERSLLDGSHRRIIVRSRKHHPNQFAISHAFRQLYWTDAKDNSLYSCDLSGKKLRKQRDLKSITSGNPAYGLTVIGNTALVSSGGDTGIYAMLIETNLPFWYKEATNLGHHELYSIVSPDVSTQPMNYHPCSSLDKGGCAELCLPTEGTSYRCTCSIFGGKVIAKDGKTCEVPDEILLFAQQGTGEIAFLSTDKKSFPDYTLVATSTQPAAVAYDPVSMMVYWSDLKDKCVYRAPLNGSYKEVVLSSTDGVGTVHGLAFDWQARRLYFTNVWQSAPSLDGSLFSWHKIEMLDINTGQMQVIRRDVDKPRGLALDLTRGYLYYTDSGLTPKVMRCHLDGSQPQILLDTGLSDPCGVAIGGHKVFVVDSNFDNKTTYPSIQEYDPLQSTWRDLGIQALEFPQSIAVHMGTVFVSDWSSVNSDKGFIRSFYLNHTAVVDDIREGNKPSGLLVASVKLNSRDEDLNCLEANCSHGCIGGTVDFSTHCYCPSGTASIRAPDNRTCTRPDSFLLYADLNTINLFSLDEGSDPQPQTLVRGGTQSNFVALAYDSTLDMIYWSDHSRKAVFSSPLNEIQPKLVYQETGLVDGIAVSPDRHRLYWTVDSSENDTGHIAKLNVLRGASTYDIILSNLNHPRAIVLHPNDRWMYWTEHRDGLGGAEIHSAKTNGHRSKILKSGGMHWPNSLVIQGDEMYIADSIGKIFVMELDGSSFRELPLVSKTMGHVFGMVLLKHVTFFTDWTTQSVVMSNLVTGIPVTLVTNLTRPTDIVLHHPRNFSGNYCFRNDCLCIHGCVPLPRGLHQCICPEGTRLQADSTTCLSDKTTTAAMGISPPIQDIVEDSFMNFPTEFTEPALSSTLETHTTLVLSSSATPSLTSSQTIANSVDIKQVNTDSEGWKNQSTTNSPMKVFHSSNPLGEDIPFVTPLEMDVTSSNGFSADYTSSGREEKVAGSEQYTRFQEYEYDYKYSNESAEILSSPPLSSSLVPLKSSSPSTISSLTFLSSPTFYETSDNLSVRLNISLKTDSSSMSLVPMTVKSPVSLTTRSDLHDNFNVTSDDLATPPSATHKHRHGKLKDSSVLEKELMTSSDMTSPSISTLTFSDSDISVSSEPISITTDGHGSITTESTSLASESVSENETEPIPVIDAEDTLFVDKNKSEVNTENYVNMNIIPTSTSRPTTTSHKIIGDYGYGELYDFTDDDFPDEPLIQIEPLEKPRFTLCPEDEAVYYRIPPLDNKVKIPVDLSAVDYSGSKLTVTSNYKIQDNSIVLSWEGVNRDSRHMIVFEAEDNMKQKAFCQLMVILQDVDEPKFTYCPEDMVLRTTHAVETIFWPLPEAIDNVGIREMTSSHSPGSPFSPGENSVNYTAIDLAGNEAHCRFKITILQDKLCTLPEIEHGGIICSWSNAESNLCSIKCERDYAISPLQVFRKSFSCKEKEEVDVLSDAMKRYAPCLRRESPSLLRQEFRLLFRESNKEHESKMFQDLSITVIDHLHTMTKCKQDRCSVGPLKMACSPNTWCYQEVAYKPTFGIIFNVTVSNSSKPEDTDPYEILLDVHLSLMGLFSTPQLRVDNQYTTMIDDMLTSSAQWLCAPGKIADAYTCVSCPPGTLHNTTSDQCELCPLNTYQTKEAQISCMHCDSGLTSPEGATTPSQCKSIPSMDEMTLFLIVTASTFGVVFLCMAITLYLQFKRQQKRDEEKSVQKIKRSYMTPNYYVAPPPILKSKLLDDTSSISKRSFIFDKNLPGINIYANQDYEEINSMTMPSPMTVYQNETFSKSPSPSPSLAFKFSKSGFSNGSPTSDERQSHSLSRDTTFSNMSPNFSPTFGVKRNSMRSNSASGSPNMQRKMSRESTFSNNSPRPMRTQRVPADGTNPMAMSPLLRMKLAAYNFSHDDQ
ncbi:hypothetical protein CHS0354_003537 [Potamilus streckersoni]|uniref:HYR domain-containing protein n=1 Tax=Potamilus streckersoni TaxID=2493646 RepID=A0AAE0VJ69_9BIVA|nr:hypothetical protein CHS0354_003537 [Potamilus streckersoni]